MPFRHDPGVTDEPNRIKEWRDRRGLLQTQLAKKVRTTQPTIVKLESGEMQLTEAWLRKLAKALTCAPADLMHGGSDVAVDPVERDVVHWLRQAQEKNQKALVEILKALAILDPSEVPAITPAAPALPAPAPANEPPATVTVRPIRTRTLHEPPPRLISGKR